MRLCLEMEGCHIEAFLEISYDAAQKKSLDVFIFPLLTNMCCKTNDSPKIIVLI